MSVTNWFLRLVGIRPRRVQVKPPEGPKLPDEVQPLKVGWEGSVYEPYHAKMVEEQAKQFNPMYSASHLRRLVDQGIYPPIVISHYCFWIDQIYQNAKEKGDVWIANNMGWVVNPGWGYGSLDNWLATVKRGLGVF